MRGPLWLRRILRPSHWQTLDQIAGMEDDAAHNRRLWQHQARTARGEELWQANLMVALLDEFIVRCGDCWRAAYLRDDIQYARTSARIDVLLDRMDEARNLERVA